MADEPDPGGSPPSAARPKSGRRQPGGVPTPHDAVFRRIFAVPANAASQLRAVLPSGITARLDLARLAPVPGSFVDEALKWRHSDVLFTAPLDGQDAFVYVLVEHQSSDDPLMAFRVPPKPWMRSSADQQFSDRTGGSHLRRPPGQGTSFRLTRESSSVTKRILAHKDPSCGWQTPPGYGTHTSGK